MFAWILGKLAGLKMLAIEIGAALLVGMGLYETGRIKGGKAARDSVEAASAHETLDAVKTANEVQAEVQKLPPGAAQQELEKEWTRK